MKERVNTKRYSRAIDLLVANCENTLDLAQVVGHQQAEAWAAGALREAKTARANFDEGRFEYIQYEIAAATERRLLALQYL